jgi:DNA-binding SARP family transcriptional activator
MAGLQLRILGNLEVIRGDDVLELPPSRKTRGLLAFLALAEKPLRREQLCELLWEIPDDPRGSLRWSLSKIRKLVDDADCARVIANRSTVAFDTSTVHIDVESLHQVAENATAASLEQLTQAVAQQGAFLEGLDLTNFHEFHTWCIGERERTVRSQARVLAELCSRHADQPEDAVDYAAALVSLLPFDESPRADLIRLLSQLDRQEEAKYQLHVGKEMLAEAGIEETGALSKALRVPRKQPSAPAASASSTPQEASLVGRERELEFLSERIDKIAHTRSAHLVLIRGEPGLGKSCLLQAAAAMARKAGARLFKASAFESEMIRPFGVWNDALRRGLPGNNPARLFLDTDQQLTREQVFSTLVDIFRVETDKGPVVVICDDIQWADESSFSAVQYLLRNHSDQPLLFVVASREMELKEHKAAQSAFRSLRAENQLDDITLEPLPSQQIEQLISRQFPDTDASALASECSGNPLLALELARAGMEGGRSLSELVSERLSRMDENAETVLYWAAVLTPRININSLKQATGLERELIDSALEQAEQQGILHPGERGLRFSHELIRRSLYELISASRRRAMHRQIAEQLAVDAGVDLDVAAVLAHHAQLSGDPYLACKAMVSAGKLCIRFYANDQAMDLYRQGMKIATELSDAQRICLILELGQVRLNAEPIEDWQHQVDEFVRLAEEAIDHGSPPHARLGYQMASYLRWEHGELQGAKRFSMQAERVSRGATDKAQILGMAEAAKCLAMLERDLSRADAMAMEARAMANRLDYSCAALFLSQGILRYYEDKFDEAVECLEDARTQAKSDGDRFSEYMANEYLTIVELERGESEAAYQYASKLVAIAERMREGSERPFSLALLAVCHYSLTQEDAALESTLHELRAADAKQRLAFVLNRSAIYYLEHGELKKAFQYATEALEMARVMERPSELLQAYINLEHVHNRDKRIAPESYREQIRQLSAGSVAGWVRKRSEDLLQQ